MKTKINSILFKLIPKERISKTYWTTLPEWNYKENQPVRYQLQKSFLNDLIPKNIKKTDTVLDLACADGELSTFLAAPYCKKIDAFDLSTNFINKAKERQKSLGFEHIHFEVQDLCKLKLTQLYDHCFCMGLFTCFTSEYKFHCVIHKLSKHLKIGGKLFLKDSLGYQKDYYMKNPNYAAVYRSRKNYLSAFKKYGFALREEVSEGQNDKQVGSHMFMLEKVKNTGQFFIPIFFKRKTLFTS